MIINTDKALKNHVAASMRMLSKAFPQAGSIIGGAQLDVGADDNHEFAIPGEAVMSSPVYVADSCLSGIVHGLSPEMEHLAKNEKNGVGVRYTRDSQGRYDLLWERAQGKTFDAAGPFINGSLLAPNAINYINNVYMQPVAWSNARSLVDTQAGDNPWASAQFLPTGAYSGWGKVESAGSLDNTMSTDAEVQAGLLAQKIINIRVTYKLSAAELAREGTGAFPLSGRMIAEKEKWAKHIKDVITDGLIYYGNAALGTVGLLNVNSVTVWTSVGSNQTLTTIDGGASTSKGSLAYQQLASAVADFLTTLRNMATKVKIRMSPRAYNLLAKLPYSDIYNPEAALAIMMKNFLSGQGRDAQPAIEIQPDPMLDATYGTITNEFNTTAHDYLVFVAEGPGFGLDEESKSMVVFGEPLKDFTYPTVPQQNSTQFASIRRVSGIFAPLTTAVKVYSTYGI